MLSKIIKIETDFQNSEPRNIPVQTVDTAQALIIALYDISGSWRKLQTKFFPDIPFGTLHAYGHGRPVINPDHRLALGLAPLEKVVAACGKCGKIHAQVKTCKPKKRRSYRKTNRYFDDHKIA